MRLHSACTIISLVGFLKQGSWKLLNELDDPELKDLASRLPSTVIHRARGSNFTLVRQTLGTRAPIDAQSVTSYCVKHNQHAKHDKTIGCHCSYSQCMAAVDVHSYIYSYTNSKLASYLVI